MGDSEDTCAYGDLQSRDQVVAYMNWLLDRTRDEFVNEGSIDRARALLISNCDPDGNDLGRPCIHMIPALMEFNPAGKDEFASIIVEHARRVDAFGVIFISEAWVVELAGRPAADKSRPPSEHPDRKEVVYATLEHRRVGQIAWRAYISRDAEGKPTLGPWLCDDVHRNEGRFGRLLWSSRAN